MTEKNISFMGKQHANRYIPIAGAIVAVLALIGLLSAIFWTTDFIGSIMDNTKKKEELEAFITPVVIFDPVPFNNVADADKDFLLQASMWAALLSESREGYAYDDIGLLLVPSTDLDAAAVRLFGESMKLTHKTFEDYDASYLYDEATKAYHVPLVAKVSYSPKVEKIIKKGDALTVKIGYVPPGNIWAMDVNSKKYSPSPDKYMVYEMKKVKNGYNIIAIRDLEDTVPKS